MWRSVAIVLAIAASGIGCGARDAVSAKPTPIPACPDGTPFVKARDIVGKPPSGFELLQPDPAAMEPFVNQFKTRIGKAWRGYDARVLVHSGEVNGAAVVVINAKDQTGGNSLVAGFESAANERDVDIEKISIAGRDGRLVQAVDGGYLATAPARECAIVFLVADRKQLVTEAASVIPPE
ncbi:MAG TPA: hypothetical protein VFX51_05120 [Solirubrobacteraceae bacterium]|nr:hypothetical protein [Solirubrobacteraceae bacterium]